MKTVLSLMVLATLAALAGLFAACSSPVEDDIEEAQVEAARATESAQRAQIIAALEPLDPLRYHEHDATIRNDGRIPADAVIWARRAREVLDWVDWPPELDGHVEQYGEWLDALLAAFREDDAHAASEPSKIAHALAHTFESTLEAWLNNESLPAVPALAGLEPPMHAGHESDDEHDSMSHEQQETDQNSAMSEDHGEHEDDHEDGQDDHDDHDE